MAQGILHRGFTIRFGPPHGPANKTIRIPRGTRVVMLNPRPRILFAGYPEIQLFRGRGGIWYVAAYGEVYPLCYDPSRPPYPLSYYK